MLRLMHDALCGGMHWFAVRVIRFDCTFPRVANTRKDTVVLGLARARALTHTFSHTHSHTRILNDAKVASALSGTRSSTIARTTCFTRTAAARINRAIIGTSEVAVKMLRPLPP